MTWDEKYLGIFSNIFWTLRYAGLQGKKVGADIVKHLADQKVLVPKDGQIYVRRCTEAELIKYLLSQEEILNHCFNIAFDIAGGDVVSELLCRPLGIEDAGLFESYNRKSAAMRFGLGGTVTQPDGFFLSSKSLIGVELKLDSFTSLDQIAKYMALMHREEKHSGKRESLGLLYIVPEKARESLLSKIGMKSTTIDTGFIVRLKEVELSPRLETSADELEAIAKRVRLASVSWTWLRDRLVQIESELDARTRGDQTLLRLLTGLRTQIEKHGKTGIPNASR